MVSHVTLFLQENQNDHTGAAAAAPRLPNITCVVQMYHTVISSGARGGTELSLTVLGHCGGVAERDIDPTIYQLVHSYGFKAQHAS